MQPSSQGILLVDKPEGKTSFSLVAQLRRKLGVKKIGHCGTLDPIATGLMILLVGRSYTKLSNQYLCEDKEYLATIKLGVSTDSYDLAGVVISTSDVLPSLSQVEESLTYFQGVIDQTPPMFSAKKIQGKRLYELARKGEVVDRKSSKVNIATTLLSYDYPELKLHIACSKGTYIRSLAHDLGERLGCGAHISALRRIRSGSFHIQDSITLDASPLEIESALRKHTLDAQIKGVVPLCSTTALKSL